MIKFEVIEKEACTDCASVIANGEVAGDPAESTWNEDQFNAAIEGYHPPVLTGEELGFRMNDCELCGGPAGDRHMVELGYE